MKSSKSWNWRRAIRFCLPVICFLVTTWAQEPASAPPSLQLQAVLNKMDQVAANFRTTQAAFVWNQYQKVVDETDTQKGTV